VCECVGVRVWVCGCVRVWGCGGVRVWECEGVRVWVWEGVRVWECECASPIADRKACLSAPSTRGRERKVHACQCRVEVALAHARGSARVCCIGAVSCPRLAPRERARVGAVCSLLPSLLLGGRAGAPRAGG
jgi:hypothetical protein